MATERLRRARGDGGLHWDETRQRWIGTVTTGYDNRGKRVIRKVSARTKTEAGAKLKALLRDFDDGLTISASDYTVADAVAEWLAYGLNDRDPATVAKCESLTRNHVLPGLGPRRLRDLRTTDVDRWLAAKAPNLSTSTLRSVLGCLDRAVRHAMARDQVRRNVVALCKVPAGRSGRTSKALTMAQATAVLAAVESSPMRAYVIVSLLTGARTEELRALTWDHVDLEGALSASPPVPPHVAVWRFTRRGGDTKTRRSRRTLALPARCVTALRWQAEQVVLYRSRAGNRWQETGLVFPSHYGTVLDAANVRRAFRTAIGGVPGLDPAQWTPREMRHSFVSLLSDGGVPLDQISLLVGHRSTAVTETIYRQQIRPVLHHGAVAMDQIFAPTGAESPI